MREKITSKDDQISKLHKIVAQLKQMNEHNQPKRLNTNEREVKVEQLTILLTERERENASLRKAIAAQQTR